MKVERKVKMVMPSGTIKLIIDEDEFVVYGIGKKPYIRINGERQYLTKKEQEQVRILEGMVK